MFKQAPVNLHTQWTDVGCVDLSSADVEHLVGELVDDLYLQWQTCNPVVESQLIGTDKQAAASSAKHAPQEANQFETMSG